MEAPSDRLLVSIISESTMAQEGHSPVLVFDSPVMVLHSPVMVLHSLVLVFTQSSFIFLHSPVLIFTQSSFNFYTVQFYFLTQSSFNFYMSQSVLKRFRRVSAILVFHQNGLRRRQATKNTTRQ